MTPKKKTFKRATDNFEIQLRNLIGDIGIRLFKIGGVALAAALGNYLIHLETENKTIAFIASGAAAGAASLVNTKK